MSSPKQNAASFASGPWSWVKKLFPTRLTIFQAREHRKEVQQACSPARPRVQKIQDGLVGNEKKSVDPFAWLSNCSAHSPSLARIKHEDHNTAIDMFIGVMQSHSYR
ncbi:MAG: hypothetical protein ABSE51_14235 [Terracidiphilus sp.]|jgi:hypothetical protein